MYASYFGLSESPFSISPDPRYLYLSKRHREAMAHLVYGIRESGGFVQLTGEVGTGKTTLCRSVLNHLPSQVDVALILNPRFEQDELLPAICDELRIPYPRDASPRVLLELLNKRLLATFADGRRTVLIIDEAQLLSKSVLEEIRLLTNLETTRQKLLQIILIGQPELAETLRRPELRQLAQRVTARYHLDPLSAADTAQYIAYRLSIAGCRNKLFSDSALRAVYRHSGGVPRLINLICDRALLGAYSRNRSVVDVFTVRKAAREVLGMERSARGLGYRWWLPAAAAVLAIAAGIAGVRFTDSVWPRTASSDGDGDRTTATAPETARAEATASDLPPEPAPAAPVAADVAGEPGPTTDSAPTREQEMTALPVAPPLEALLRTAGAGTDAPAAFTRLAALWGVEFRPSRAQDACAEIGALGLRCLSRLGSWEDLRRYNRVAALVLFDGQRGHHVLVTALDGRRVTLEIGGESYGFDLDEVDRLWSSEYLVLWRPPTGVSQIAARSRGADVLWLRQALNRAIDDSDAPLAVDKPEFDKELRERVIVFQRRHALQADGVVGAETFIRLNTVLGEPGVPMLVRTPTS